MRIVQQWGEQDHAVQRPGFQQPVMQQRIEQHRAAGALADGEPGPGQPLGARQRQHLHQRIAIVGETFHTSHFPARKTMARQIENERSLPLIEAKCQRMAKNAGMIEIAVEQEDRAPGFRRREILGDQGFAASAQGAETVMGQAFPPGEPKAIVPQVAAQQSAVRRRRLAIQRRRRAAQLQRVFAAEHELPDESLRAGVTDRHFLKTVDLADAVDHAGAAE